MADTVAEEDGWMKPDLMTDETYCPACGYIGKKREFERPFGERGAGSGGSCPLCLTLMFFARQEIPLSRNRLFRKNFYGPYAPQQRCSRCGKILINDNSKHTLAECDEILQQTWEDAEEVPLVG